MAPRRSASPAPAKLTTSDDVPSTRVYSWKEVASHNTAESAWVIVSGKVYDVTDWLDRHPGGREMILLCAGRECTELIASYHPFSDKPQRMLTKFEIGLIGDSEFPSYAPDTGFYKEMCREVKKYFDDNNLDPKSPIPGLWRMAVVFSVAGLCLATMNNVIDASGWARVVAAIIFGVCQALPLLHMMHDSSHTAFGPNETWWKFAGRLSMDWFAGASMMSWHHQHVVGHHIYTNVMGADPDMPVVEQGDPRRIVERQVWTNVYKWQHIYLPPLYGVLGLKFRLQDFTDTFFSGLNGPIRVNMYDSLWLRLFAVKVVWVLWRIIFPLYYLEVPAAQYWTLFVIAEVMTGYWLAFNFQVSHVSEIADFPHGARSASEIDDEWAVSQVKSSVDYSHNNWLTAFLSGALNYQTVHHLFPGVSQYHYPAMAPIVMRVCNKYRVDYLLLPSFASAFSMHLSHLRNMGKAGKAAHIE